MREQPVVKRFETEVTALDLRIVRAKLQQFEFSERVVAVERVLRAPQGLAPGRFRRQEGVLLEELRPRGHAHILRVLP